MLDSLTAIEIRELEYAMYERVYARLWHGMTVQFDCTAGTGHGIMKFQNDAKEISYKADLGAGIVTVWKDHVFALSVQVSARAVEDLFSATIYIKDAINDSFVDDDVFVRLSRLDNDVTLEVFCV